MAPVRLRHADGISTLQIPLDDDGFTVSHLQQEIYSVSKILPSDQSLKTGYPPRTLTLISELPVSSLGLKKGDQLIVSGSSTSSSIVGQTAPTARRRQPSPSVPRTPLSPLPLQSNHPEHVEAVGGFLIHRIIPDDNSCLFTSVAIVFEQNPAKAQQMRQIVAEGIRNDPETYNDAILGMSPSEYISTITKPTTWGGAIELQILADHYKTEITSLDVETGRVDRFSPTSEFSNRVFLIYSGIHYDAATLAPTIDAPDDWHQSIFPITKEGESDPMINSAKRLVAILRSKKAFTNTATFDLRCEECGKGLKGEKEARGHAESTGHTQFGEF